MALPPQKPVRGDPNANGDARDPVADRHASEELAEQCGQLEEELERLRARYEMYFLGVERREPNRDRDELKRRIERIKTAFTRNTGLKFRLQTLGARYLSYERMWTRSAREKEEGTYRRDLFKARRHAQERVRKDEAPPEAKPAEAAGPPAAPPAEPATVVPPTPDPTVVPPTPDPTVVPPTPDPTRPATAVKGPQTPATPPAATAKEPPARPTPPAARPPAAADPQMRALYAAYVEAKKRCNEDVSRITYEAVAKSIQKQIPELLAKYKARTVEFKVVIQGGKAVLKAVPRS